MVFIILCASETMGFFPCFYDYIGKREAQETLEKQVAVKKQKKNDGVAHGTVKKKLKRRPRRRKKKLINFNNNYY